MLFPKPKTHTRSVGTKIGSRLRAANETLEHLKTLVAKTRLMCAEGIGMVSGQDHAQEPKDLNIIGFHR